MPYAQQQTSFTELSNTNNISTHIKMFVGLLVVHITDY